MVIIPTKKIKPIKLAMRGTAFETIIYAWTSKYLRTDSMDWIFSPEKNGTIKWSIAVNTSLTVMFEHLHTYLHTPVYNLMQRKSWHH